MRPRVTQLTGAQILDAHTMIDMSYGAALLRLPNGEFVILKAYIGVAEEEDVACALHDSDQVAEWAKYRKMKAEHEGREINPAVASLAASEDRKILERAQAINEAAQEASGGLRKEPKR